MVATQEGTGTGVGVQFEARKSGPTPAERMKIRNKQEARIAEGKRGIAELGKNGIDLQKDNEKSATEIIASIPGWQKDPTTEKYVEEAQQLYQELEAAKQAVRASLPKPKEGEQLDEAAIAVEAEEIVFENRMRAAIPEGDTQQPDSSEAQPVEKDVVRDAQGEAIRAWVEKGALGEDARPVLEYLAAGNAVRVAEKRVKNLSEAFGEVKNKDQRKIIASQHERAVKVLEKTKVALEKKMKENDRLRTDPQASVETRLLAYDIDTRQTAIELSSARATMGYISLTPEDQRDPDTQARYDEAKAKCETLEERQKTFDAERELIGTPEQRQVDYVVAEVVKLTGDLSKLKNKEGKDITEEEQQKRELQRRRDPIGYLQGEIDKVGISSILENSDMSEEDQKNLTAIATTRIAERSVLGDEIKDKSLSAGKTGIMALLLILYTAYGSNKKAKGQQA